MLSIDPPAAGRSTRGCGTLSRRAFRRALRRAAVALAALALGGAVAGPAAAGPVEKGLWISLGELQALPMSGSAWSQVKKVADGSLGTAKIADQDSDHDVKTLAVALAYARTGTASYRSKAADAIMSAVGTEAGGRTLALGRNLVSYVIAADLINLREYSPSQDATFRSWLSGVRTKPLDGDTLVSTHERRANNWGTHAGASRIAADVYLGDTGDLGRAATVFRGWLGDRSAYAGFKYGGTEWQCDPAKPVGVNPTGCTKEGKPIDGVLPEEQRRAGRFTWPPPCENYVGGALQGALAQAELLSRAAYPAWTWSDRALYRAVHWFVDVAGCALRGDDEFEPWLVNKAYGTRFAAVSPARLGKNVAYTDWTHAR